LSILNRISTDTGRFAMRSSNPALSATTLHGVGVWDWAQAEHQIVGIARDDEPRAGCSTSK